MERKDVFKAIISERGYQDIKWGGYDHDVMHNPSDYVIFIERVLSQLKDCIYEDERNAGEYFRKIAALCVAYGEVNGMPSR